MVKIFSFFIKSFFSTLLQNVHIHSKLCQIRK